MLNKPLRVGCGLIPLNIKLQQDDCTVCCGHTIVYEIMKYMRASFQHGLRKIFKIIFFLKKYERKTDSKLNTYIDFSQFLTTREKNQPKQVKSLFLATFRFLCPLVFFLLPILILRDNKIFSYSNILRLGFKICCKSYTIAFWRLQNSNS